MVEELAARAATNVPINLLATGIAVGSGVAASKVRSYFRQDRVSVNLGEVANVFTETLEEAIKAENERSDTKELTGFTDNWEAIAEELAATPAAPDVETRRDAEEVDVLFTNEEEAVTRITEAYATVENIPLDRMPDAHAEIRDALTRAYRRAVEEFQDRIGGTDLEKRLEKETDLVLAERLADLQERLAMMEEDVEHIITQEIYNEGFRQFSRAFFARQSPSPEQCWRGEFSLADVEAGIPAERDGIEESPAGEALLSRLRAGEDRMVVGRPGSGKSTLCKQVAVRWYEEDGLGEVLYRETGTSSQFESTDDLREAIERGEGPVLVVVEDVVRAQANSIAETIEEFENDSGVRFLLDARREELDAFDGTGSPDVSANRRRGSVLNNVTEYPLPVLSVEDVERVCEAFTDATDCPVRRDAEALREELRTEDDLGIGEMLLLSFLLPAAGEQEAADGLEAHVRARYETITGESDEPVRDLSEFDGDLLADVGAMVNLLNASELGIHQELVHALAYEHGHDIETHGTIEAVLEALEGWVLFPDESEGPSWTTHPLWSTLYLRELALEHAESRGSSRRRSRSEKRVGTCLESLFRLFDDADHRDALADEFPGSPVVDEIATEPQDKADEYLNAVFELGKRWPVLAVLFGTTDTARYDLPDTASDSELARTVTRRGHAHRARGAYSEARTEYEHRLEQSHGTALEETETLTEIDWVEQSREADDRQGIANSLGNLGLVARNQGAYEDARDYHHQSLDIARELGDRQGIAASLTNLGVVAGSQGDYEDARDYFHQSLNIQRDIDDRQDIATSLNNLGLVACNQGAYEDARDYHHQSLDIARELGDRQGIATSLNNLGLVARNQGAYEDARDYHHQSLDIARELGDRQGIAQSLGNLGLVAESQGDYDDARDYFHQSLDIARELGDRQGIAQSLGNLGSVADARDAYEEAHDYHHQSLDIARELGDRQGIAHSLVNLGNVAHQQGAYEDAREYYQQSLDIARELGDRQGIAHSLGNLGLVAESQGDYDDARDYHQQSLDIARELGDRQGIVTSLVNLGEVALQQDAYEEARDYHHQSLDIARELGDRHGIASNLDGLGLVAASQGAYNDAREYYHQSLDIFEKLDAVREELKTRRSLVELEIKAETPERARERCEATRARLDELDRDLPGEREQLEQVCADIPEE